MNFGGGTGLNETKYKEHSASLVSAQPACGKLKPSKAFFWGGKEKRTGAIVKII